MGVNTQNTGEILELIKAHMQKEEAVRKKIKLLNWVFPLLILAVFFLFFWLFYSSIANVDKSKFIAKVEQNSVHLWPEIGSEVTRLGTALYPHYAAEVEKALTESMPEFEKQISDEMEIFELHLNEKISNDLLRVYDKIVEQQKASLLTEFPELKGNDQKTKEALALVQGASIGWIKEKINKAMQEHVVAFLDLRKTLDANYRLDLGKEPAVDPENLLSTWLQLLDESLLGENTLIKEPANKKIKRAASKGGI